MNRLRALVDMHMLDPHKLRTAVSQSPKRLSLNGVSFHQSSEGVRSHCRSALAANLYLDDIH